MAGYLEHIAGRRGTASKPYVIDLGGALLDGGYEQVPIYWHDCEHVILRNFDACNSRAGVIWGERNHNCRLELACAWNANEADNYNPVHMNFCTDCQVMDVAGWGTGRKIMSASQQGSGVTWYRCYARWERSLCNGNKIGFALAYKNFRQVFAYCIGECLQLPTVQDGRFRGIFATDWMEHPDTDIADTLVYRCLAASPHAVRGFDASYVKGVTIAECVDATAGQTVDASQVWPMIAHWSCSPLLSRLRALAGVDVLDRLRRAVSPQQASEDAPSLPL